MAESFGTDPERYDRARPRYPRAMVEAIMAASPGRDVLDVGVGTGIVARQFQAAGATVLGVDVDARMAGYARQRGTEAEVAAFEDWDPAGRTFDLVIAGQTWHWIDPVAGAAKAAEALRPGGRLAVFWNAFEPPAELRAVMADASRQAMVGQAVPDQTVPDQAARPRDAKTPQVATSAFGTMSAAEGYSLMRAKAAGGVREAGGFGDMEEWRFEWERSYTRDEWLDQIPTSGGLAQAPPEKLSALLAGVGSAIDGIGGSFTARYTTVVGIAARTGA
ncbi:MAG: methyltransferase domain-containing protein [Nocardiopsaceae bacterium]|nr:methyltransferase domain-containing protein [Nocardiopsaceae bacterium]